MRRALFLTVVLVATFCVVRDGNAAAARPVTALAVVPFSMAQPEFHDDEYIVSTQALATVGALTPQAPAGDTPQTIRVPKPPIPAGPRRVAIQVGHLYAQDAPDDLGPRIRAQTGTSWAGITEVSVNLDIAERVAALLRTKGYAVDVLPTTIPPGCLADAFVALHADGDGVGSASGFKAAHGARRGPWEDTLLRAVVEEYQRATGLDKDMNVTRSMLQYYGFNWSRYQHALAPHTPAIILEMGFLSNEDDRSLMLDQADVVAAGIATGVLRFLDEVPAAKIFGQDIVVPVFPALPQFRPLPTSIP